MKLSDFDEFKGITNALNKIKQPEVKQMAHREMEAKFGSLNIDVNNTNELKVTALNAVKMYKEAADRYLSNLRIYNSAKENVEKLTQLTMLEISNEKNMEGKPKFPNDAARKAELYRRMNESEQAKIDKKYLDDLKITIEEEKYIMETAKTILEGIKIISTL